MAYTKYSLTPANNNAAPPDGAPEGMLPSAVNDTMRDMMAQIRDCGDGIRGGTYTMTAPVITGGSISGSTMSSNVITSGSINNTPIGASTANTGVFTSLSDSGSLTFTGTGNRITGDLTNATVASRVLFQTSTANSGTFVGVVANGTIADNTGTGFNAFANSDTTSSQSVSLLCFKNLESRLTSGSNTGTYSPLTMYTGGSERLRIDTSGNVGIGVTPASWSLANYKALQVGNSGLFGGTANGDSNFSSNAYYNSGWKYIVTAGASYYNQNGGSHIWYTSPSGTAGNAITFTERMRIDSSGNVTIGRTAGIGGSKFLVKASTTGAGQWVTYTANTVDDVMFGVLDSGAISTGAFTNSPYNFTTGSAANMFVASNGLLYRSTSSLKYKTDVQDATHGLAEVLKLRPVTYKGKNDGDTVFGGLIAEEVDKAGLSEFVVYRDDDGTPDALNYGNMVSLAFKAIQEQQAMIEELKAKVAALEAA